MAWDNIISRITWLFLQPSNLIIVLLLISLIFIWRERRKAGLIILSACILFYGLVMFGPLTNLFLVPLEARFSIYTNEVNQGPYNGIIVLAGSESLEKSTKHHQVTLTGASERLIEAAKLARKFPDLPLIYCGGTRKENMMTEVEIARKYFTEAGIDLERIRFDDTSYNTYTNALEAKKLIKPDEMGKWLLVTSASHMPRSVGSFRKAKINIQPYPVDYRSALKIAKVSKPDAGLNMYELDFAVHEWIGLLVYYITGHSEDLFPAP